MSEGWLEVSKELIKLPGFLVEIYGDLAKPGVRQVGKALETVLGLGNTILLPIALANGISHIYIKRNLEGYRKRLESIPEDEVIPLAPEIGVPIIEKLAYVADPHLSELYLNLLAKASKRETVSEAHPSFVNIINNLCPDEAMLLDFFYGSTNIPFIMVKSTNPQTDIFIIYADFLFGQDVINKLNFPDNVPAYISNFNGLGLVQVDRNHSIIDDRLYDSLEKTYRPLYPIDANEEWFRKLEFVHCVLTITDYGKLFLTASHDQNKTN